MERPQRLPARFGPLVLAITGRAERPLVTSGAATRRALRAAGARAATTGSTIHLGGAPEASPQGLATLAHELVHVAAASRRPRFLLEHPGGGDDEERRARRIGEAVHRAAATPTSTAGVARLSHAGPPGMPAAAREAGRAVKAERDSELGAHVASAPPTSGMAMDGHSERMGSAGLVTFPAGGPHPGEGGDDGSAAPAHPSPTGLANASSLGDGGFDELIELLEERLLAELERRGGRYAGVF